MYDRIVDSMALIMYLFEGYCIQYLFSAFAMTKMGRRQTRRDRGWSRYAVSLAWIVIGLCSKLLFAGDEGASLMLRLLFAIFLLFLFSLVWYQGKLRLKIFLVMEFTAIHELAFFISYSMLYIGGCAVDFLSKGMEKGRLQPESFMTAAQVCVYMFLLLTGILQELLLFASCRVIVKSYRYRDMENPGREVFYYLLSPAAGILLVVLLKLLMITVEDGNAVLLYSRYPSLYLIIPVICAVLLGTIVLGFRLYQDMAGLQRERAEKVILENQISQMQSSMAEMENLYDGVRAVRHDMKNHMEVLRNLLQKESLSDSGMSEEIREYFEDMDAAVEQLDGRAHTGNPITDAVIGSKFRYAEREIPDIRLDAEDFSATAGKGIRAYDIGIILNNGLDNAIEACKRLREEKPEQEAFIRVRSFKNGKMYFLEIENSFDGKVHREEGSGRLLSTKENKKLHGIGLKNIESCARKYGGDMDCIITDNRFILSVMLKG